MALGTVPKSVARVNLRERRGIRVDKNTMNEGETLNMTVLAGRVLYRLTASSEGARRM